MTPRTRFRLLRFVLLRAEFRLAPTEPQRLFILTILIGVVCGLVAVAFHLAIALAERHLIERALDASGYAWVIWTVLAPTLGGLFAGVLLQYVVPSARGSGIPQVKIAYAAREGVVPLRDAIGKFVLGSIQIGSGASLGREGPTVQICAGIASAMGRVAGVSAQSRRRLIPVGAAAGIAAAFNAPIAAVTFTIEELVGTLDQTILSGVIVAAALAAVIERSILGENPVLGVTKNHEVADARSLLLYAGLGVTAALVSIAFTDGLLRVRAWYRRQRLVPPWAQPATGGAITGALAVIIIATLHTGGVTGGGYDVLKLALSENVGVRVMLALCVVKLVATVSSYSSGGAGGIFAPSLFIGAMLGGAFGSLDRAAFDHPDDVLGAFALVGMGAVFSATIRAPITSVLIIIEMTSGYGLILPLMIANMSAYVIARHYRPKPIYDALLFQDGVELHESAALGLLEGVTLDSITDGREFRSFRVEDRPSTMLSALDGAQPLFPVVDARGSLRGIIMPEELRLLREDDALEHLVNAGDIMRPAVSLKASDHLANAVELMKSSGLLAVPILDDEGRVVCLVNEAAIAKAYWRKAAPKTLGGGQ